MKQGLAIWHYPHRTVAENVAFFADRGYESLSILGRELNAICSIEEEAEHLAHLVSEKGIILTVHHRMPANHEPETVDAFYRDMDQIGRWQERFGVISILSFDAMVRERVDTYINYVTDHVPNVTVAMEDFGLNEAEREQLTRLKAPERFSYLVDVGHMFIRMCNGYQGGATIFKNAPDECPPVEDPVGEDFLRAFRSKERGICEIHLHNNNGEKDMHSFLEEGRIRMDAVAYALKAIGYEGIVTVESVPGKAYSGRRSESDTRILETTAYWQNILREAH